MQGNGDRKGRLIEIAITILCSAIVSAATVAWTLSATLATFNEKIAVNNGRLTALESRDLTQIAQLSAQTQANSEILRRLERIEDKIDGR